MTLGLLFMILGLVALLVVLFKRAAGIAMVGAVVSLGVATAVVTKWEGLLREENTENPELEHALEPNVPRAG